ncbi:hypothetical protein [Desulfurobacterium atlanticum]|uniref:Septum formation initiator n=1 Tax=Desulfurobacterium atlanticum TaxID=240169 RepID=A0A238ZRY6_9BACT|nr:hypothetical protein [Desulfurobacterium atlanticum]SNR85902.1 hypothetical protein SAMN06265340_11121 [Desulfurobacterium atlanticum]
MIQKIAKILVVGWAVFVPFYFYSYFVGENSLTTLRQLEANYKKLLKEKEFWQSKIDILSERIKTIEKNKDFYYEKLAREMFIKGKEGEETFLFVRKKEQKFHILNRNSTKTEE